MPEDNTNRTPRLRFKCEFCPRLFDNGFAYSTHQSSHGFAVGTNNNPPPRPPPCPRRRLPPLLLPAPMPPPPPPPPHRNVSLLLPPPPPRRADGNHNNRPSALRIGGPPRSSAFIEHDSSSSGLTRVENNKPSPQSNSRAMVLASSSMVSTPSKGNNLNSPIEIVDDNFKAKDEWKPKWCFDYNRGEDTPRPRRIAIDLSTGRKIDLNKLPEEVEDA